ncbi:CHAP domain-containing protein [Lactococcus garvieae]|uniref:Immunogenic secreted protein n=1 Tax=Lactococcus garvieae DCC43 TaxID=1231377 RepID=K2PVP5_9LACT|nr:CHAP domain-containing protein [Lactococcus garvieae]EKF51501.1 Immunogenic secreted protein [Lactococcus garvieae DCC43]
MDIRKKRKIIAMVFTAMILAGTGYAHAASAAQVNVYRLYNKVSKEHLYTASKYEYNTLPTLSSDWVREGINFKEYDTPVSRSIAVNRVYNPRSGEHIYTKDSYEVKVLTSQKGWRSEGVAFYAPRTSTKPVYRLFNAAAGLGAHFVTADNYEKNSLVARNWKYEGVAWYQAVNTGGSGGGNTGGSANDADSNATVPEGYTAIKPLPNLSTYSQNGTYPWGQCTWYTYYRARQMGVNFGTSMGNGGDWQKASGYQVTMKPRARTAVSFSPGQAGADRTYGHVAFVEQVRSDGSILISESNVIGLGKLSYRTFTKAEASKFHYVIGK